MTGVRYRAVRPLRITRFGPWRHRPSSPRSGPRGEPAAPTEVLLTSVWSRRTRATSLPAGITRAGGAGCKRPPALGGECDEHSTTGPFFATKGGGACSPDPDPERQGRRSAIATGRTGIASTGTRKSPSKRGGRPSCVAKRLREWPREGSAPHKPMSESSRRSVSWTVNRSILAGG